VRAGFLPEIPHALSKKFSAGTLEKLSFYYLGIVTLRSAVSTSRHVSPPLSEGMMQAVNMRKPLNIRVLSLD
jgi:hypothetical protein